MCYNDGGKRSKLKRFYMIKLKTEVNKSAIMKQLRKEATEMYNAAYEGEYAIEQFLYGAERLFNLLRLPRVSKSEGIEREASVCDHELRYFDGTKYKCACGINYRRIR